MEFLKKKDTSILYFFMIYSNLVSKLMISHFEIFHFKGISQTSLTSMQSIVDARNLKFWENNSKVVLKKYDWKKVELCNSLFERWEEMRFSILKGLAKFHLPQCDPLLMLGTSNFGKIIPRWSLKGI